MDQLAELLKILAEEYEITTPWQLFAEVKKLGGIDITPLCAASRKREGSILNDNDGETETKAAKTNKNASLRGGLDCCYPAHGVVRSEGEAGQVRTRCN